MGESSRPAVAPSERRVAYCSMEIALEPNIPTYTGGLGILAGDTLRSAADLKVPIVAVTLLYRQGYIMQRLDADGRQIEEPATWVVEQFMRELPARVSITIEGRTVALRAWTYEIIGVTGYAVPVLLLDADVPENSEADRGLTSVLYGGDNRYRLCQEAILGIGGLRMLRALGYDRIERFHMNEGHASLLTVELSEQAAASAGRSTPTDEDIQRVRRQCVFTTHTPVPAGHDRFPMDTVSRVLGDHPLLRRGEVRGEDGVLNMTLLALFFSRYVNAVAKKHAEVSRQMFPQYVINAITNGVHLGVWTSFPFQDLYDRYIPGWREDNFSLRHAAGIPDHELWDAHAEAKRRLLAYVNAQTRAGMQMDVFTIGFGRRATGYKRADLLICDPERLKRLVKEIGPIQIIYAGKAHPRDQEGKDLIQRIVAARATLAPEINLVYLANYDMELGRLMTSGVDLWLNTPQPPLEASGTSGMKAATNGVPSLSVLDGWWIEGHIEGMTGWSIGQPGHSVNDAPDSARDAEALYDKLEHAVLPMFYHRRSEYVDVMRHAIAINAAFFNTQRMVEQYVTHAYFS